MAAATPPPSRETNPLQQVSRSQELPSSGGLLAGGRASRHQQRGRQTSTTRVHVITIDATCHRSMLVMQQGVSVKVMNVPLGATPFRVREGQTARIRPVQLRLIPALGLGLDKLRAIAWTRVLGNTNWPRGGVIVEHHLDTCGPRGTSSVHELLNYRRQ